MWNTHLGLSAVDLPDARRTPLIHSPARWLGNLTFLLHSIVGVGQGRERRETLFKGTSKTTHLMRQVGSGQGHVFEAPIAHKQFDLCRREQFLLLAQLALAFLPRLPRQFPLLPLRQVPFSVCVRGGRVLAGCETSGAFGGAFRFDGLAGRFREEPASTAATGRDGWCWLSGV